MTFWNNLIDWMSSDGSSTDMWQDHTSTTQSSGCNINPATCLPMINDDCCGVDVGGSPYGMNIHDTSSIFDTDTFNRD